MLMLGISLLATTLISTVNIALNVANTYIQAALPSAVTAATIQGVQNTYSEWLSQIASTVLATFCQ